MPRVDVLQRPAAGRHGGERLRWWGEDLLVRAQEDLPDTIQRAIRAQAHHEPGLLASWADTLGALRRADALHLYDREGLDLAGFLQAVQDVTARARSVLVARALADLERAEAPSALLSSLVDPDDQTVLLLITGESAKEHPAQVRTSAGTVRRAAALHLRNHLRPGVTAHDALVRYARTNGLVVEVAAALDDPDVVTATLVEQHSALFDAVHTFALRDLGRVRNATIATARGEYVACLDGDDLWCEDWIAAAVRCARTEKDARTVWHPQFIQFFDPDDDAVRSRTATPSARAATYVMKQPETTDPHFDRRVLLVDNLWTSNVLAPRTLHLDMPYPPSDPARGLGIEDWSWNLATVWAGVAHRTVPDTVHMIRMKTHGSLARENAAFGLLPYLPEGAHLLA